MLASANSGGGANTNGAGTVTTGAEAVKRLPKASAILVEAFSCSLPGLNPALIHGTTLWALAAIEGHDSFDIDDSAEEFEDPTRWTSNGGKGKDKVSEPPPNEPYSSGEGGSTAGGSGIRDGADGHVNNVASAADAEVIVTPVSSVSRTTIAGGGAILKIVR